MWWKVSGEWRVVPKRVARRRREVAEAFEGGRSLLAFAPCCENDAATRSPPRRAQAAARQEVACMVSFEGAWGLLASRPNKGLRPDKRKAVENRGAKPIASDFRPPTSGLRLPTSVTPSLCRTFPLPLRLSPYVRAHPVFFKTTFWDTRRERH
jgi:hypothetical protein